MEPMGRGSEKYRSLLGRRPYARIASAIVFSVGVKRGRGEVAAAAAHLGKRKKMVARGMAGAPRDWDVGERGFGGQGTRGMAPDFRREAERFLSLSVKACRREGLFNDLRDV